MGAKQKVTQAPTMTPQQLALLNAMMRGVQNQMQGVTLGQGWAGPGTTANQGVGGTPWSTQPNPPVNPIFAAIKSASMPVDPNAAPNPFTDQGYAMRDQATGPIVNPFRRSLGG